MKQLDSERSEFPSEAVRSLRTAILNNSDAAVTIACGRLKPYIEHVAKTYCKRPAELPRFEQAALITIMRAARRFNDKRGKPIEHLVRIAIRHAMLDELKSDAACARRTELFAMTPGEEPYVRFQNAAPSPADLLIQSEVQSHLSRQVGLWLQSRPAAEREFIFLLFFEDLSQAEIARRFGLSRAAISKRWRSTITRARVELADLWQFFSAN